jgi:hypothetical protein
MTDFISNLDPYVVSEEHLLDVYSTIEHTSFAGTSFWCVKDNDQFIIVMSYGRYFRLNGDFLICLKQYLENVNDFFVITTIFDPKIKDVKAIVKSLIGIQATPETCVVDSVCLCSPQPNKYIIASQVRVTRVELIS